MRRQRVKLRALGQILLAFCVLSATGCFCYLHPVGRPRVEELEPCQALPKCCRQHVYVFFVNGLDPVNCGNLTGVRDYVQALGFNQTYYGQMYHGPFFAREIRRLQQEDPEARFALVGFSLGASVVQSIAESLKTQEVHIDLLVYVDGVSFTRALTERPENVGRVVNVTAPYLLVKGESLDGEENHALPDGWHFASPTHPQTLERLAHELTVLGMTVPDTELPATIPQLSDPTPRPVMPHASAKRDQWDFLKPVSRLRMPPSDESIPATKPATPDPLKIASK